MKMRKSFAFGLVAAAAVAGTALAQAPPTTPAPAHNIVAAAAIQWVPGPPVLPKGVMIAVITGDPGQPGTFVLQAKLPAGYTVPPHWHPVDEDVTLISGAIGMGMGDTIDAASLKAMTPGSYAHMPAQMHHFLKAKSASVVQVTGTGPFQITYVNPADDPRNAPAAPAK